MDEELKKILKPFIDKLDKDLAEGNIKFKPIFEVRNGKLLIDEFSFKYLKGWEKKE